jgi:hypothetical protein
LEKYTTSTSRLEINIKISAIKYNFWIVKFSKTLINYLKNNGGFGVKLEVP